MENEQNVAPGEGLIYGLNDRPPLKDTIFAALQHLLAISFRFRSLYFHTVQEGRAYRLRITLYPGNKFLFYRSYHISRTYRRAEFHIRSDYCGFYCRDAYQPCA